MDIQFQVQTKQPVNAESESAASPEENVAILVCQGMGRQVPFETIDTVATLIKNAADRHPDADPIGKLGVKFVEFGKEFLPRAELQINSVEKHKNVHIYEAYWAPLTEGKVTLRDVHSFLKDATPLLRTGRCPC